MLSKLSSGLCLVALTTLTTALSAQAVALASGPPVTCPAGSRWNPDLGQCVISISLPPGSGDGGHSGQPVSGNPTGGSGGPPGGGDGSDQLPTIQVDGQWCLPVGPASPQPAKSDPVWKGHTDGTIYNCLVMTAGQTGAQWGDQYIQFWAAANVAAPAPPDPAVLARMAMARMTFKAIGVGLAPHPGAGYMGLVGMPNWMWVSDPNASTWGPQSKTVTIGPYSVTATAKVDHMAWDMGDGQQVVCNNVGTVYDPSFGRADSPTCGHTYTQQGTYTVRATSYWTVAWTGLGQSGTIPLQLTQSSVVTIGEAQVLTK